MKRGSVDLAAVLDWATRKVPAWRVSISLTADFSHIETQRVKHSLSLGGAVSHVEGCRTTGRTAW